MSISLYPRLYNCFARLRGELTAAGLSIGKLAPCAELVYVCKYACMYACIYMLLLSSFEVAQSSTRGFDIAASGLISRILSSRYRALALSLTPLDFAISETAALGLTLAISLFARHALVCVYTCIYITHTRALAYIYRERDKVSGYKLKLLCTYICNAALDANPLCALYIYIYIYICERQREGDLKERRRRCVRERERERRAPEAQFPLRPAAAAAAGSSILVARWSRCCSCAPPIPCVNCRRCRSMPRGRAVKGQ